MDVPHGQWPNEPVLPPAQNLRRVRERWLRCREHPELTVVKALYISMFFMCRIGWSILGLSPQSMSMSGVGLSSLGLSCLGHTVCDVLSCRSWSMPNNPCLPTLPTTYLDLPTPYLRYPSPCLPTLRPTLPTPPTRPTLPTPPALPALPTRQTLPTIPTLPAPPFLSTNYIYIYILCTMVRIPTFACNGGFRTCCVIIPTYGLYKLYNLS